MVGTTVLGVFFYMSFNFFKPIHCICRVTLSMLLSGHTAFLQGVAYIVAQLLGAIVGAAVTKGLRAEGVGDVGCFAPSNISHAALWGWETIATFFLITVIFAVCVSQKGSGNTAPLAIGLALYVSASACGALSGGALNIARVLGPSVIYGCAWDTFWIYLLAGLSGSVLASAWGISTNVVGPFFLPYAAQQFFAKTSFVRSTPYSTATDPLAHYETLSSHDSSLPPYGRIAGPRYDIPAKELHKLTTMTMNRDGQPLSTDI